MGRKGATGIGFIAILTWAFLALLSAASGRVPPFQLLAMTFGIGSLCGVASWIFRPGGIKALRQSWSVWALGVGGLFFYHLTYFAAIQAAPALEVSLIAYLWPLLIVVFSALLPGEQLKAHHVVGVLLGIAGAVLVITRGDIGSTFASLSKGHALAVLCAVIWSGYSVLSRRTAKVPSDAVAGFSLATAALALLCHLAFENTHWPATTREWAAITVLGLLPLGAAFYAWDYGVKHGDIMVLGAASYAAPLLSTLVLLAAGMTSFHWSIAAACVLITAGAILAARDMLFKQT